MNDRSQGKQHALFSKTFEAFPDKFKKNVKVYFMVNDHSLSGALHGQHEQTLKQIF